MVDTHPAPIEYLLKPGYIVLYQEPAVVYIVLGSCVAVSLFDTRLNFGGLCHFQFPEPESDTPPTARFGSLAIPKLYRMMLEAGAQKDSIQAQVFGGADKPGCDVGAKNAELACSWLEKTGIRIVSQDVGGEKGRKIMFNVAINEAVVHKATRIRNSDWFPYREER